MELGISFGKYIWENRIAQYPNRRKLTKVDGSDNLYDVERYDEPNVEGTPFSAETMNGLEDRIGDIKVNIDSATADKDGLMNSSDKKKLDGINISSGSEAPSGGNNGDIYLRYS